MREFDLPYSLPSLEPRKIVPGGEKGVRRRLDATPAKSTPAPRRTLLAVRSVFIGAHPDLWEGTWNADGSPARSEQKSAYRTNGSSVNVNGHSSTSSGKPS